MARRPRSAMRDYQSDAASAIAERRRLAVLLNPGYGKTALTETGLADLRAWPALVVAPAQVVKARVWQAEAAQWDHLHDLTITSIAGSVAQRTKLLKTPSQIEVVSYENLMWLSDVVDLDARYKAIVFDELPKLKSPSSKRFTRMRHRGTRIPIRVGLTGSPVSNHLLDLWGELYMIGGPEPLGPTFGGFQAQYFQPGIYMDGRVVGWVLQGQKKAGRHTWIHTDRSRAVEREIHRRAAPWCYVLPPQPEVKIPPVLTNLIEVPVPDAAKQAMRELEKQLVTHTREGLEIEALSAVTKAAKLRQITGGSVYDATGETWGVVHDAKLDKLDDLIEELQGEPLLVFYWYKHEAERILARVRRAGLVVARAPDDRGWLEAWNARRVEVLLAHPASVGHGLNMQPGGHNICWFSLPNFDRALWVQGNGRLARSGQTAPWVTAHVLACGGVDAAHLAALDRKQATEDAFYADLLYDDLL